MENFGERLHEAVIQKGLTKKDIDSALDLAKNSFTLYTKHNQYPSAGILIKLAQLLDVSTDWLLLGKEPPNKIVTLEEKKYTSTELRCHKLLHSLSPLTQEQVLAKLETLIEVIDQEIIPTKTVPIIGYSAAGLPIDIVTIYDDYIETPLLNADFALIAKGDSMEPLIHDHDLIFVRQTNRLETGEIGIVQINQTGFIDDEEVTCKIFKQVDAQTIELTSVNPQYKPITVNIKKEYFRIIGKVIF